MRHGQTDWNLHKVYMGSQDIPLNATGKKQAQDASELIHKLGVKTIFSSDLTRAHETAQIVANKLGLSVQTTPHLREPHGRDLEGRSYAPGSEDEKLLIEAWNDVNNWSGVSHRTINFICDSIERLSSPILFVSHGSIHRAIWEALTGEVPDVANCHIEHINTNVFKTIHSDKNEILAGGSI